ncbi:hypothetical protein GcM3_008046 [Golovinomyces cichoracearum]|uniref:Uncharacterized protein n=1 Tax=Golovinomyces cichoracearum TaxID=62708 RepID=A0A420JAJ3_9PEZI|nr:hypothetical protein GcM3_008046 [Golovinomyces cichoracearum]
MRLLRRPFYHHHLLIRLHLKQGSLPLHSSTMMLLWTLVSSRLIHHYTYLRRRLRSRMG